MNAPSTTQQQIALLPIGNLFPSPTNPRKRFDEVKLRELATSVKAIGIAQPLLVRAYNPLHGNPLPGKTFESMQGHYEIIAGERRYRAAKLAELAEVPCFVRELTNQQVLHIQLIENLQRDDLHPIEEAEGYERLMLEKDELGNPYTADTIAAEIGKSRSYVFQRRKLLALCPDARQAFYDGKLDASTALLIARIPVEKLQLQALKDITAEADWGNNLMVKGDKMSYRKAREILQDKYMLDLDRAIFDPADAALLPKAGSCTDCPKRTGNAPDLFDDVGSKDVCTDTVCFGMKKAAHVLKLQKEAENTGAEFIAGKAAKKLLPNNWSDTTTQLRDHGYATLDTPVPGDKQKRTIGQLLEENKLLNDQAVKKTIVANPHREGQTIETVNIEAATKALREAGFEITLKGKDTAPAKDNAAAEKEKAKLKLAVERETAYRQHLFTTLRTSIKASTEPGNSAKPGLYALLAELALDEFYDFADMDDLAKLMRLYQPDIVIEAEKEVEAWNEFMKLVPDFTPQQHFMLLFDVRMLEETGVSEWPIRNGVATPKIMTRIAEAEGIDPAQLRADLAASEKAEKTAKKPAAKKPAAPAKTTSTPTPAAQAQDLGAETKPADYWPFPTPNYSNAPEKKTKRKAAAAA